MHRLVTGQVSSVFPSTSPQTAVVLLLPDTRSVFSLGLEDQVCYLPMAPDKVRKPSRLLG